MTSFSSSSASETKSPQECPTKAFQTESSASKQNTTGDEKITVSFSENFFVVLALLFLVGAGFLVLDLSPLNNRITRQNSGLESNLNNFFSQNYFLARERFRIAAINAGAVSKPYIIYTRDGVDYTTDVAVLHGEGNDVLIHISGFHGVDGFIGSAIQTKILQSWNEADRSLVKGSYPTVVFIHGMNPYGMSVYSVLNENNVDITYNNKNALNNLSLADSERILRNHRVQEILHSQYTSPRLVDRYLFFLNVVKSVLWYGYRSVLSAVEGCGQHKNHWKLWYGGETVQKNLLVLHQILEPYASRNGKVTLIDVRSGGGREGQEYFIIDNNQTLSELKTRIPEVTDNQINFLTKDSLIDGMTKNSASSKIFSSAMYSGGFVNLDSYFSKAHSFIHLQEVFGTCHLLVLLRALLFERSASYTASDSYVYEVARIWLRDAYYPQTIRFKESVLEKGIKTFDKFF